MAQASRAAKNLIYAKKGLSKFVGAAKEIGKTSAKVAATMVTRPFTNSDVKDMLKSKGY